jgi:hypothetical protein
MMKNRTTAQKEQDSDITIEHESLVERLRAKGTALEDAIAKGDTLTAADASLLRRIQRSPVTLANEIMAQAMKRLAERRKKRGAQPPLPVNGTRGVRKARQREKLDGQKPLDTLLRSRKTPP